MYELESRKLEYCQDQSECEYSLFGYINIHGGVSKTRRQGRKNE